MQKSSHKVVTKKLITKKIIKLREKLTSAI